MILKIRLVVIIFQASQDIHIHIYFMKEKDTIHNYGKCTGIIYIYKFIKGQSITLR
jgi:hypothetical protein